VRTEEIPDGGSAGTVSLTGVLGDIVSSSTGEAGNSDELDDFNGNLNLLHVSLHLNCMEERAYRSSLPSASGLGLLGLGGSELAGRLVCLCLSPFPGVLAALAAVSSEAFRETVGRSRDPFLDVLPTTWGPTILIRAIVSGEGERRKPSAVSRIGDDGAEEVNGSEDRLSGSGRLKGAGAGSACVICGTGGKRWFEIGTSLVH